MDIAAWLRELRLERYEKVFFENDVDFEVLRDLSEADLEKIGISSLGARRKILKSISNQPKNEYAAATSTKNRAVKAERRQLTILFADVVGSTALASAMDPEDLGRALQTYQDTVADTVNKFGGHVAQFLGDGVLAYFGWPKAYEDAVERAVEAALDIGKRVKLVRTKDGHPINARVGIATGLVVVGDIIGGRRARGEMVVGTTPNLAARLQALAEPGQIVISPETRALLGSSFNTVELGLRSIKGFPEEIGAFAVTGRREVVARFDRTSRPSLPIFEREHELVRLQCAWRLALAGEPQAVLIAGEPGIGKSRLLQELKESILPSELSLIEYQCSPLHSSSAFWPVIQVLIKNLEVNPHDSDSQKISKLTTRFKNSIQSKNISIFANLLGLKCPGHDKLLSFTPQQLRAHTMTAILSQIIDMASNTPLLILAEDVHWIDSSTEELFARLLRLAGGNQILLVLTSRNERFGSKSNLENLELIAPKRLTPAGCRQIIERLSSRELAKKSTNKIIERADGIPLFVEELTKTTIDSKTDYIPISIQDSLTARLESKPETKSTAQLASCIGREFSLETLVAIDDDPEYIIINALRKLISSGLLIQSGDSRESNFIFNHALVRDAAYAGLLHTDKKRVHERIANFLASKYKKGEMTSPEVVAQHYKLAQDYHSAVVYYKLAGERAHRQSALKEARDHYQVAAALLREADIGSHGKELLLGTLLALGNIELALNGYGSDKPRRIFEECHVLAHALKDSRATAISAYGVWVNTYARGDAREAMIKAETLAVGLGDAGSREIALIVKRMLTVSYVACGELKRGSAAAFEGSKLLRASDERTLSLEFGHSPGASINMFWSMALFAQGYCRQFIEKAKTALRQTIDTGQANSISIVIIHLFFLSYTARNRDFFDELFRTLKIEVRKREWDWQRTMYIADAFDGLFEKKFEAAESAFSGYLGSCARTRTTNVLPFILARYAYTCVQIGKPDLALMVLDRTFRAVNDGGFLYMLPETHRLAGVVRFLISGDFVEVERACHQAMDAAHQQGATMFELHAALTLEKHRPMNGNLQLPTANLAAILERIPESGNLPRLREAKRIVFSGQRDRHVN